MGLLSFVAKICKKSFSVKRLSTETRQQYGKLEMDAFQVHEIELQKIKNI
jgi:hypothetical protein